MDMIALVFPRDGQAAETAEQNIPQIDGWKLAMGGIQLSREIHAFFERDVIEKHTEPL